jgi:hypothetical protein
MQVPFEAPEGFDPDGSAAIVRFSPNGRRVVVAPQRCHDWAVVVDAALGKQVDRFAGKRDSIRAEFLTNDQLLLQDGAGLAAYELGTKRKLWSEPELCGWGAWVNPRRNRVMLGRGGLHLRDLKTRKRVRSFGPVLSGETLEGTFSPDGSLFALDVFQGREYPSKARYVQVWELKSETLYRLLDIELIGDGDRGVMAFSPDNRVLAVTVEGGALLFALKTGRQVGSTGGPFIAQGIRFSSNGRSLELVGYEGAVYRVNARTGRVRQHFPPPDGHTVGAAAISDRGLVAGVVGASVLFWQLPEWEVG